MKKPILEVCADSVDSAIAAQKGGADRLELCSALVIGGITPSSCLFEAVRKNCTIKIHVLIRPRFGDFCYSPHEFEVIKSEVALFKKLGADGVVIGCLNPNGTLDIERLNTLKALAHPLSLTLHRAFDMCKDPFEALEQAKKIGINTILTSGQAQTCLKGRDLLTTLAQKAGDAIDIMAGGSVSAQVIATLRPTTKLTSFHLSGKKNTESTMTYRKNGVNMGVEGLSEYEIWVTDEAKVREAALALKKDL